MKIGVQLYSLRKYLKNEDGYKRVFAECKRMGAQTVQLSGGAAIDSKRLAAIAKDTQLEICVTHSPFERIVNDLDRLAEEHLDYGCPLIGIGMMPKKFNTGRLSDLNRFIEILNLTSEKLQKYGMSIAYHNHWFEFGEIDGVRMLDRMIDETLPSVQFIPDTFWIKVGGGEPIDYLRRLNGRAEVIHLKDCKKIAGIPVFRAIGRGTLDFSEILAAARTTGVKSAVVELDVAPRPLKSMEFSLNYIKGLG